MTGLASRFGGRRDSKWGRHATACKPHIVTDEQMHVCAHRTLPCGTVLIVENARNGLRSKCVVADRGPFGACLVPMVRGRCPRSQWRVKIRTSDPGTWRGILDLTPAVTRDLSASGLTPVRAWVERKGTGGRRHRPRAGA